MKKLIFLLFFVGPLAFAQVDAVAPKYDVTRPNPKTTAQILSMTRMQEGSDAWNTDTDTMWRYVNGAWVDTGASVGTDDQAISLVGNTLTLEDGGTVDLTPYLDNKNIASGVISGTDLVLTLTDASTVTIDVSTLSGGASYTAGNGLNLNTNEFSVDSTRVLLVSGVSPILGPWEFAAGTNAQLDALAAPVAPVKRFSFAIDGGVGYVSGSASGTGDMLKSTYDPGDNGIVDNSEALGGVGLSNFMRNNSPSNIATNHTLLATNQLNFNSVANYMKPTANGIGFYNSSAGATSHFYDGVETGQWNSAGLQMLNGNHIRTTNEVYGIGWNASLEVPTKDAVYDKIESLGAPTLATVLSAGNSAGSSSINMNGQNITGANTISGTSGNITTITSSTVSVNDAAYAAGWNGSLAVPTRNAVYDEIELIRPTSGSGTSGVTLIGTTSGSYTITSQTWRWAKSGDLVTFTVKLTNVNGTTPAGPLRLELSGTTIPGVLGASNDYVFQSFIISAGAYYPDLHVRNFDSDSLDFYTLEFSGTTAIPVSDADFASTTITVTGSFIAN